MCRFPKKYETLYIVARESHILNLSAQELNLVSMENSLSIWGGDTRDEIAFIFFSTIFFFPALNVCKNSKSKFIRGKASKTAASAVDVFSIQLGKSTTI